MTLLFSRLGCDHRFIVEMQGDVNFLSPPILNCLVVLAQAAEEIAMCHCQCSSNGVK